MFLTACATCSSQGRLTAGEGQTETVASMGDWHLSCEWRELSSAIFPHESHLNWEPRHIRVLFI